MTDKIVSIHALEILDSRGLPTLEVFTTTSSGFIGKAAVPSGASTGEQEAVELRDADPKRYLGRGVLKAIEHVNGPLTKLLLGRDVCAQKEIDQLLIEADGTPNKHRYGANAILGISLSVAKTASVARNLPLHSYIHSLHGERVESLPIPMMNILNGGAHADNLLDFQEFMIRPIGFTAFKERIRASVEVFQTLKQLLKKAGHVIAVGDEGGFAPRLRSNEEALDFIVEAICQAGYQPSTHFSIAIDCAASGFFDRKEGLYIEKKKQLQAEPFIKRSSSELITYLSELCAHYPIDTIEDGLDENDWEGWQKWTAHMKGSIQIIGDDIFVTNSKFLQRAIDSKVANSILIKPNQIGTLSETLQTIQLAQKNGYATVISHRSGETEDTSIADIAVGAALGQIKTGSLSRSERIAKYNRLLEIEDSWVRTPAIS